MAALFEADPGRFAERVAAAEKALAVRARELFQAGGQHLEEEHAMEDTLHALQTLRYSRNSSGKFGPARVERLTGTSRMSAFGD